MTLPDDVLAEISLWYILRVCNTARRHSHVALCSNIGEDWFKDPLQGPPPYSWLAIRHICRAWRAVALAYPQLSAYFCLTRPECVQDMLSRAGALPLHVFGPSLDYVSGHWERYAASRNLVLAHPDRIASGSMAFANHTNDTIQTYAPQANVCNAWSLDLSFTHEHTHPNPTPSKLSFPHLRELRCANYALNSIRPMLAASQLRKLKLVECRQVAEGDLFALLRPLLQLEELTLCDVIGGTENVPHVIPYQPISNSRSTIHLPNLRDIRLSEPSAAAGLYFLHRISYPPPVALHLSFKIFSHEQHLDCDCLLIMLLSILDNWRGPQGDDAAGSLCFERFDGFGWGFVNLLMWRDYQPMSALKTFSWRRTQAASFRFMVGEDSHRCLNTLISRLPLSGVRSALLLDWTARPKTLDWSTLLNAMSMLEELALYYETLPKDIRRLYPSSEPHEVDRPFTSLKAVHIRESAPIARDKAGASLLGGHVPLAGHGRQIIARIRAQSKTGCEVPALHAEHNAEAQVKPSLLGARQSRLPGWLYARWSRSPSFLDDGMQGTQGVYFLRTYALAAVIQPEKEDDV
ncbi:hypothetical protein PsYK624_103930 [Phanerochaete sordida]|uniref:F-box domain-containing protein n=1 Tax=Phanerochaete sordida TaxID=48140 RepID=A0A9P3LGD8_9APHY|nr:hypothetical protein PsYK624_103930 [Phanerochaete sordida]